MELKLKNNSKLECSLPDDIKLKITSIFHQNTPSVNALSLINDVVAYQKTHQDEVVLLNRIRADIGNVEGPLSGLMELAGMAGFNDNYEPQAKPRLVGTYTINDWYTQEHLAEAQAAFDGLTIVPDQNYLIDFNELAVQTLNPNEANYNPAVAIELQSAGYGNTLRVAPISGQNGRWFITKTQAAAITNYTLFRFQTKVDVNGIITPDTSISYTFDSFNEFLYFTGYSLIGGGTHTNYFFWNAKKLRYFIIPNTITELRSYSNAGVGLNNQVVYLQHKSVVNTLSYSPNSEAAFICGYYRNNRYILSGYRDKYEGLKLLEEFIKKFPDIKPVFRSYYNYAAPQISYDGTNVTMTVERTSDIYYTIDGSYPTINSTKYTNSFAWDGVGVIKAMAIDTVNIVGDIAYADDFYATTVENPTITVDSTNNQVTISCATSGAVIHYTIDGSHPTLDSPIYSAPITSQEDIVKVRCFATAQGYNDSECVGKICIFNDSLWGTDGDTSTFAVQCIDSTKPNYNPAVCIILDNNNKLTNKCCNGGGGYLSKIDAAAVNIGSDTGSLFYNKKDITDVNGIVSLDTTSVYSLTLFLEFKYFTNVTTLYRSFQYCSKLIKIYLPASVKTFYIGSFESCSVLNEILTDYGLNTLYEPAFTGNFMLRYTSMQYIHIVASDNNFVARADVNMAECLPITKIYVGNGVSNTEDDTILNNYLQVTNWSYAAAKLDTWYNYLHPQS